MTIQQAEAPAAKRGTRAEVVAAAQAVKANAAEWLRRSEAISRLQQQQAQLYAEREALVGALSIAIFGDDDATHRTLADIGIDGILAGEEARE